MSAKNFYFVIVGCGLLYQLFLNYLQEKQRKLPLPVQVADVYSVQRYQTYLNYVGQSKRLSFIKLAINLLFELIFVYSSFYPWALSLNRNVYVNTILIVSIIALVSYPLDYAFDYWQTFKIDESFGKNKHTLASFTKDFLLMSIPSFLLELALYLGLVFVFENLASWTNNFQLDITLVLLIVGIIGVLLFALYCVIGMISLFLLKKQYHFTPLAEGELRDKIVSLMQGCKKKVKSINVYDESSKSTSKNAFLLKFLNHREFGIADNFLDGNCEDELLAVLSHEIGHLKHKKNIYNYLQKLLILCPIILFIYALFHVEIIFAINQWILDSFQLTSMSYPVVFMIYLTLFKPFMALFNIFNINVTRREEYEADRNAVANGYGEALIATFKQLSSDELINVNPHPLVEWLEYDHPGMYQRIVAIEKAVK